MSQDLMKTKDDIATLCVSISTISHIILSQLSGKVAPDFSDSYFLGILSRTTVVLKDISGILISNNPNRITSAFILFRCLLDDFIHIIHLEHVGYEEEEIVKITADAQRQRFKLIEESKKINERYFDGNLDQLVTSKSEQAMRAEFLDDEENSRFFSDKERSVFKKFPTMQSLIDNLPATDIGKANVHAFIVWKILSQYVHYSNLTFNLENDKEIRTIEIYQLEEVLFYCYKTVLMVFDQLKKKFAYLELQDPDKVGDYFNDLTH